MEYVLLFCALIGATLSASQGPVVAQCARLNCIKNPSCLNCTFPQCDLGEIVSVNCSTVPECANQESTKLDAYCSFCWQLDEKLYDCAPRSNCSTTTAKSIITTCEVHANVICRGNRHFSKRINCNWSSGLSWTKTMILSITLGGFGADRFYLGLWKSGIGKLFSFGGLGVWTVVDIVLVATGYLRPADGSMYM